MPCIAITPTCEDRILKLTVKGVKTINCGSGCTPEELFKWMKKFKGLTEDEDLLVKIGDALKRAMYIDVIEKKHRKYFAKDPHCCPTKQIDTCPLPNPPIPCPNKKAKSKSTCTPTCTCTKLRVPPCKRRIKPRPCPLPWGKAKPRLECCPKCKKIYREVKPKCRCKDEEEEENKVQDYKSYTSVAGHSVPSSIHSSRQSSPSVYSRC